ncbi:uncharacterized protein LOC135815441 isoform X4 [Sycon ciliatum]|uniref:uncharacterized protein LOC135815441 isoform X4 n=1 Tax=Sycon ciliatum TaxID=27933 RepID=UPI0031F6206C
MMSEQTSVTSHNSDDDDEIGEELLDEFRSLVGSRLSTSSVSSRRRQSSSPQMKTAKVLESCLYDLDKQKDVMLQTLTIMEQNSADRIVELGADLTKAQRSAREWEQRSNEVQSRSEDFQQDVHALVNILSLAYHSGQWKFASTDFRTVTSDMLPPTGSSSKEGMRVSLVEKQLSERGRKIQSLQQELVSGSAQHRVLKEQITQRDNELADLRQSLATNQEQLSNALSGLQTHEQEAGTRHTSLMDEVERRDGLLRSLQEENARLQELRSHDVKTSMASGEQLGQLQADVVTLTANLEAEHGRSTELRTQLHTEHQTNEDLKQKLSKQEEQVNGLMERLNSQISELQSNVAVVEDKYKTACSETEEARAQMADHSSSLDSAQADASMYRDQLLDCRAKLEQWETTVTLLRNEHGDELTDRDQLISQLRDQVVGVSDGANEQAKKHSHAYGEVARSLEETITTLRRTQDEVVEKSTSLSRLQAQVSQLESEKTKLLEKGSHSTEEVAKLNISVETLQQENKLCLEQIAKLEDTNTAISAKMTVLQENLNQEQEEVDTLNEAKNSLQASVDRLQEQCMALETAEYDKVELQAEVETLQHQLHVARAELSENETSLEKQHADLVEMEATCARHKDMIQARDEEIERLKESDADEELEQKVQELELQLLDMKDDVSNANCSLQQSQDEAEQWKTTSEANETNLNRFKSECERVRQLLVLKTEELQTAQDQASELERNRTKMLQEVHVERDRATQLQIEVNLLRHHRSEVEESLTRELESLRSHSNYIAKADQLSRELTDAGQELTQLRRSLAAAEEEHDKVIAKLRAEQDQNVKLQARCIAAENSARKSAEAAESSKMEAQNAEQQELQQVKQTSDILTAELTQRQTVIDVLRKEIDDLKVQSRLNVHELKLKRLRVQQIDQDVDAQRIQNSVLREKIMAHERQQTMLEVALEKSQEEREKLSQKITELVSAARHPKANNALSQKASDLEEKVTLLRAALSDSQSEFQSLRQRYGDVQAELEASRQRHAAETSVLEAELNNLRSEQNSADGVHHQLVSQLQTTVNTLGGQLDKVSLQRDEASGDSDDADESHHSLRQSLPFSPAASFLRDVTVAHLESKCSDLESELSASHALRSSVQQYEHQRLQEQQDTFEKEREMLRKSLTVTRDDLKQCRSDLIEKDRQIFKLSRNLEKAESSRQEHLRKVSDIEASVAKLSSPQKSDGDGAG